MADWLQIIDKLTSIDDILRDIKKILEEMRAAPPALPAEVDKPVHAYIFELDALFRWLEHIGAVQPTIVEVPITVEKGEKGYADLWLPEGVACIERHFEIHFPYTKGIRYGWRVDDLTRYTVPMHYFIPNRAGVEENIFGRYWIKWRMLRFEYEAYESGTITIRAWARLVKHEILDRFLEYAKPLAEKLGLKLPPPRPTPQATSSELVRECKICGARLLKTADGKLVREGRWARVYSDHECPVFR